MNLHLAAAAGLLALAGIAQAAEAPRLLSRQASAYLRELLLKQGKALQAEFDAIAAKASDAERGPLAQMRRDEKKYAQDVETFLTGLKRAEADLARAAEAYNRKVAEAIALRQRYKDILARTDVRGAQASADAYTRDIQKLANEMFGLFAPLRTQLQQAQAVQGRLKAFVADVKAGRHSGEQGAKKAQDDFNRWLQGQASHFQARARQLDAAHQANANWSKGEVARLKGLYQSYKNALNAYNGYVPTSNAAQATARAAYNDYKAYYDKHGPRFTRAELATLNQWKARYLAAKQNAEAHHKHLVSLRSTLEGAKATYGNALNAYTAEVDNRKSRHAADVATFKRDHTNFKAQDQKGRAAVKQAFSQAESSIKRQLEAFERELTRIKTAIETGYGANYAEAHDVVAKWSRRQLSTADAARVLQLGRGAGSPVQRKVVEYLAAIQLKETSRALVLSGASAAVAEANSIGSRLKSLASTMPGESAALEKRQQALTQSVRNANEAFRKRREQLRKKAGELTGTIAELKKSFEGRAEMAALEAGLVARALGGFGKADLLKFKQEQRMDERIAELVKTRAGIERVFGPLPAGADWTGQVARSIAAEMPREAPPAVEWKRFEGQEVKRLEELSGAPKAEFAHSWSAGLLKEGAFRDSARALADVFPDLRVEWERVLAEVFRRTAVDRLTIHRAMLDDKGGPAAYKVTIGGTSFWLDEKGGLEPEERGAEGDLFSHRFRTPENTAIGKLLRQRYAALKARFGPALPALSEERLSAVTLAESLLREADAAVDEAEKRALADMAEEVAKLALGLTPAGDAIDLYEAVTGRDIKGVRLSATERSFAALGLLAGNRALWSKAYRGVASVLEKGWKRLAARMKGLKSRLLARAGHEAMDQAARFEAKFGKAARRHTPLTGGPLAKVPAADKLVIDSRNGANSVMATFRSGTYLEVTTEKPARLYRVFVLDEKAATMANRLQDASLTPAEREAARKALDQYLLRKEGPVLRHYWTAERPAGPVQAVVDSAIKSTWGTGPRVLATHVAEVEVPAGTKLFAGIAGPQGAMTGGGTQVYLPRAALDRGVKVVGWQAFAK